MQSKKFTHSDKTSLSREQAYAAFSALMSGESSDADIASLLTSINARGASVDEIIGAASVMRERVSPIDTSHTVGPILDTCGTGGDVKGTFNISTAAAIVAASAGATVVKHGNRSASGRSGSADVLEALGVNLDAPPEQLRQCLERANICFAFARHHHPAMKHVAAVRKSLGIPTIFNLLGPLTNPAGAKHQLIGVYSPHLTELFAEVLRELGSERAWIAHGNDGLDELSTMSPTRVSELRDGEINTFTIDARDLGLPIAKLEDVRADTVAQSAAAILSVLSGIRTPARDIVLLNASAALVVSNIAKDLLDGLERASAAIDSGASASTLNTLARTTNATA